MLYFILLCFPANTLIVKGNAWSSNQHWKFLTKFCFQSGGTIEAFIRSDSTSGFISLYTDVDTSWETFQRNDLSCEDKTEGSISRRQFSKGVDLHYQSTYTTRRDRWWFFSVSNCTHTPIELDYFEFTFLNPGGILRRHFSANEFGIPEMIISFFIISFLFSICAIYVSNFNILPVGQFKLMRSIACLSSIQTLGLFLGMIEILIFASNGIGVPTLKIISSFIVICTHTALLYVGLMVSRGWGVSDAVNLGFAPIIGVFCALMFTLKILIWVWYLYAIDPADVRDPIHTWPGFCLCLMQAIAFIYLSFQVVRYTMPLLNSLDARRFYRKFLFVFGVWLFSLPLSALITYCISAHARTKYVFGIDFATLLCFYAALILLFRNEFEWRYSVDQLLQSPVPEDKTEYDNIELQRASGFSSNINGEEAELGSP